MRTRTVGLLLFPGFEPIDAFGPVEAFVLARFPDQLVRSFGDQAFHLGGDDATPGVDPDREGYPAGQGVGAIAALRPAADLVRSMVDEAAAALRRAAGLATAGSDQPS